ncbi:hypothetical protein GN244_ATG08044 [Phytophthora infestans]|uniref:Uncharacterized protein n=1 Tax=Phytophthora infestans TaxID=4787 RepID=A0A833SY99_PHYIN|nr:hypothetical protein GN244_ATG08044 [Phytophthora infestans]
MAVTQEREVTMASIADVVEIFECEGSFSFLCETHRFAFKIHSDSSLRVDIKPVSTATQPNVEQRIDQDTPIPGGTTEDIDDVDGEEYQNTEETITLQAQEEDEETVTNLQVYGGRALAEMPSDGQHGAHSTSYMVHFKIVQWGRGAQGMWSQIVKCIARLTRQQGLSGRFVDIREDAEEAQDFALRPIAHKLEALDNPLHPLTPGRYELQGITIAENTFVYECAVTFTLQTNGMMSGTSRELPFTQECPLAGMWTRSGLNFLLEYEMHGNKHTYIYFGSPFRSGLQGTWQNSELRVLGGNLDARTRQAERGILEFQLVKAARVWSETYHKDYPAAFRECVKLLLLASHRDGILPNHLWSSIVSYCGYNWFRSELQKSLAATETKGCDNEVAKVP